MFSASTLGQSFPSATPIPIFRPVSHPQKMDLLWQGSAGVGSGVDGALLAMDPGSWGAGGYDDDDDDYDL